MNYQGYTAKIEYDMDMRHLVVGGALLFSPITQAKPR